MENKKKPYPGMKTTIMGKAVMVNDINMNNYVSEAVSIVYWNSKGKLKKEIVHENVLGT